MARYFTSALVAIILLACVTGCAKAEPAVSTAISPAPSIVAASAGDEAKASADANAQEPTPQEKTAQLNETAYPESYMVTAENYFDYQTGMECAAFASAYILRHYGEDAEGLKLFDTFPAKAPDGGIMPNGIVAFFNEHGGYNAEFKTEGTVDELKQLISKGAPVIVFIHVIEPYESTHNTHYIPLIGYDTESLYFAESLEEFANCKDEKDLAYNRKTDIAKFERLWINIDGRFDYPYFIITPKP